jgi:site-specific DNA-methyltransferase (adenine-specific)
MTTLQGDCREPWKEKRVIGNATLYLGDCLEILPTLDKVEMVFTDPPYGHNNNNGDLIHRREAALGVLSPSGESSPRPIANDGAEANELFKMVLPELNRVLISKGCCCCCCCCGGGGPDPQFARWSLWMDEIFNFKQMIVWDKGPIGMGWHYRRSYETVLVAEKKGGSRWFDETDKIENIIRPGQYGIKKIIPNARQHPTEKPLELARHFIKLHTREGETVLDPFCGAGSTGAAALSINRKFIGIELDEKWFNQACERIENAQRQSSLLDDYDTVTQSYEQLKML